MLRSFQSMFGPLAEIVEFHANHMSLTTHPALHRAWESSLSRVIDDIDIEEKEKATTLQNLFTKGAQLFLHRAVTLSWKDLTREEKYTKIRELLERPQIPQRTPAWYEQGQRILTASEFSSLYGSPRQYASLVVSKAMPQQIRTSSYRSASPSASMSPFDWGIRFEPVVKQAFCKMGGITIGECGRITHATDSHLAASPDGLLTEGPLDRLGRLIEIKCPISRKIGVELPFAYWCQMQIQMEVADIAECEYLEVKIESIHSKNLMYKRPDFYVAEGELFLLTKEHDYVYAYTEEEKSAFLEKGYEIFETIPWAISEYHTEIIQRDRQWFEETAPLREKFWADVAAARIGAFKMPPPVTPTLKTVACMITDSPPSPMPPL